MQPAPYPLPAPQLPDYPLSSNRPPPRFASVPDQGLYQDTFQRLPQIFRTIVSRNHHRPQRPVNSFRHLFNSKGFARETSRAVVHSPTMTSYPFSCPPDQQHGSYDSLILVALNRKFSPFKKIIRRIADSFCNGGTILGFPSCLEHNQPSFAYYLSFCRAKASALIRFFCASA
jgi:hypothetical protein